MKKIDKSWAWVKKYKRGVVGGAIFGFLLIPLGFVLGAIFGGIAGGYIESKWFKKK